MFVNSLGLLVNIEPVYHFLRVEKNEFAFSIHLGSMCGVITDILCLNELSEGIGMPQLMKRLPGRNLDSHCERLEYLREFCR